MEILIKFPDSYEYTLGKNIICVPIENIVGNLQCYLKNRIIHIYNFEEYTPNSENSNYI